MSEVVRSGRAAREKSEPGRAPRVPFALLVTGLIAGGLALLLALNTASAANELRRHGLADQDASIAARVQQLRNEVAASAAPAKLAAAASQLGMVPAGNPAFLVVGADGVVRLLGKPVAVTAAPIAVPHKPKPKKSPSKSAKPSRSAKSTAHPSKGAKKSPKKSSSTTKRTTAPTPTSTPTPTVTLPGGTR